MFGRNKVKPSSPTAEEETLLPCTDQVTEKNEEKISVPFTKM